MTVLPCRAGLSLWVAGGWLVRLYARRSRAARRRGTNPAPPACDEPDSSRVRSLGIQVDALLAAAQSAIVITGADARIVYWGRVAERLYGWRADEALGRVVTEVLPFQSPVSLTDISTALAENRAWKGELVQRHRDGTFVVVSNWTVPLPGGLMLSSNRDLSEAKAVQQAGLVEKAHLEAQIEVRTKELQRTADALRAEIQAKQQVEEELRAQASRLLVARDEERRRLARDLHDEVIQEIGLFACEIDNLLQQSPPADQMAGSLADLRDRSLELADGVRRLSHGLHSSVLEHHGLSEAMRVFCEDMGRSHACSVRFHWDGQDVPLAVDVEEAFYRILHEAVGNAIAHGRATDIKVRLHCTPHAVMLVVKDNGRGFVPGGQTGGLGIPSMTERARLLGGAAIFTSSPGEGTVVKVFVPLG